MEQHHRRSIRLKDYDYSNPGMYFITICLQNRECRFGGIDNNIMCLNDIGKMVEKWWLELKNKYPAIINKPFIIMPNHLHAIITLTSGIVGADLRVCPDIPETFDYKKITLSKIIQWFKTMTTNEYIRKVKQEEWAPFEKRSWQRNYYEHIIRSNIEYQEICDYIHNNPATWQFDEENPNKNQM